MKIVRVNELADTDRAVMFNGGTSLRAVLKSDNVGFAMTKTLIAKGGPYHWHYTNHFEACYCIKGKGELTDLKTGLKVLIVPDMVYILDNHDDHTFEALEDTVLISVFNPPLTGKETHDKNGHYELDELSLYHKSKEIAELCFSKNNIYDAAEAVADYLTTNQIKEA